MLKEIEEEKWQEKTDEMKQVEKLRETPNIVATLEEIVDENHVIVSQ